MKDVYNHGHLIVCSAIKYADGQVVMGVRHANCHKDYRWEDDETHGFIDNKNKFLDRVEAYKVAKAADQIRFFPQNNLDWHKEQGTDPRLFSENVW